MKEQKQQPHKNNSNQFSGTFIQRQPSVQEEEELPFISSERTAPIQAKLTIGAPDDPYEREADRMAEYVMRKPASSPPPAISSLGGGPIRRQCLECERDEEGVVQRKCARCQAEEEGLVQRSAESGGGEAPAGLSNRLQSRRGMGSPLPPRVRSQMEQSFGADFSSVRVHTDNEAVRMNRELGARAFTHGADVYFNRGEYDPKSSEGRRLLGHELTHVVQQGNIIIRTNRKIIQRDDDNDRSWWEIALGINRPDERSRLEARVREGRARNRRAWRERQRHPELWRVAFATRGGRPVIYEYDRNHRRRTSLTYSSSDSRSYYREGDIILTSTFQPHWLVRVFPGLNDALRGGRSTIWDVVGTYIDSSYGERKTGWRIMDIQTANASTGAGTARLQAILYISDNEVVDIQGSNSIQVHNRESLSNFFNSNIAASALRRGIRFIGDVTSVAFSIASGSLGAQAVGRSLLALGARTLPRMLRPIFLQIIRFLGSRTLRFCITAARTYVQDIQQQEENNRIRAHSGASQRRIDEEGALQRALVTAISGSITSALSAQVNRYISDNLTDNLPHNWMQASLSRQVKNFIIEQLTINLVTTGTIRLGQIVSDASIRASREGVSFSVALTQELQSIYSPALDNPEGLAVNFAGSFAEALSQPGRR